MKRARYMTMHLIFLFCYTGVLHAAPVGNIYDPVQWTARPVESKVPLSLSISFHLDNQINHLPEQIRRYPWTDPDSAQGEERHYSQTRSSRNEIGTMGIKLGVPFTSNAVAYGLVGTCRTVIDFHYEDWTVSRTFAVDNTFESEENLYYGCGTTVLMHEGEYHAGLPFALGMDIQYRHFEFDENKSDMEQTSYSCELDEIQLALSLSVQVKSWSPYAGIKVASITGKEDYINQNASSNYYTEGYVHYEDHITWSKDIGYFVGVTTTVLKRFSLGLEYRDGDESALGFSMAVRF